jgi:hypothetical protein
MSFLYDRVVAHLDNAISDPKIEKQIQAKKAKLKEFMAKNQTFIDTQKKILAQNIPKKLSSNEPVVIYYEDNELLKGVLNELDKVNKSETNIETLAEKSEEILTRYNALSKNSYRDSVQLSEKPNHVGKGTFRRLILRLYINLLRQAIHDYPNMPSEYYDISKDIIEQMRKSLDENKYTDDDEINKNLLDSIIKKYTNVSEKFNKQKDEWGPKGVMRDIYKKTMEKLTVKNGTLIDFKELPTDPEPLPELIKSKKDDAKLKADKDLDTFSIWGVLRSAMTTGIFIGIILIALFLACIGGSIATNLNIYKNVAFRIFYAIYGSIFFPIVLVYSQIYRRWWLGKKQVYYGFIPIFPYFFINTYTQFLFGWLTYKPDNHIWDLEEWRHP